VRELVLEVERPELSCQVGQSVALIVPGDPEFGKPEHLRLYSVADLPETRAVGKAAHHDLRAPLRLHRRVHRRAVSRASHRTTCAICDPAPS
jgi:hypothetical protein